MNDILLMIIFYIAGLASSILFASVRRDGEDDEKILSSNTKALLGDSDRIESDIKMSISGAISLESLSHAYLVHRCHLTENYIYGRSQINIDATLGREFARLVTMYRYESTAIGGVISGHFNFDK